MLRTLDLRRCYALDGKHLRVALALAFPISAGFELIVVLLFLAAASRHKLPEPMDGKSAKTSMELWMISVLLGTAGLAGAVIFNFVECLNLAIHGAQLSFPHALDQKYLVLLGWGFLVPVVWGFSARWLPSFLAIAKPDAQLFRVALVLDLMGVICGVAGLSKPATILLASSAVAIDSRYTSRCGLMDLQRYREFTPAFRRSFGLPMRGW